MQNQPSESRFFSRFGSGDCSAVQFLAEGMCARQAKREGRELVDFFWRGSPKWNNEYRRQAIQAAFLLKVFSPEAILAALRTPRGKQVYSLGLKSVLVPIIKDEQERMDVREEPPPLPELPPSSVVPELPRPTFVLRPNIIDKLRGL